MNAKHRLVDTSRNPLARELLRSAELDEPPDHSAVKLALALGLGSSAVVSTITAGAAATTEVALGTAAATAAKGVAAASAVAPVAGGALAANVSAGAAVLSSAANVVTGSAVMSSAAGLTAVTAASPVVSSALSAVGMLKAMAVVSVTCGALSFGGTKLALTVAEGPIPTVTTSSRSSQSGAVSVNQGAARVVSPAQRVEQAAKPPPPPEQEATDSDEVLPALGQEVERINVRSDVARQSGPERNVGRQDIRGNVAADSITATDRLQPSLASAELTDEPVNGGVRQPAVAAFPSDGEPTAPALNPSPKRKPKQRAKPLDGEAEAELEREVLLLDRARRAVAGGQPLVALQALDAYRTQARHGTLRAESLVLRVKALLALGQKTAAERDAMPFIKAAPESRYAARLRELLGVPNNTP